MPRFTCLEERLAGVGHDDVAVTAAGVVSHQRPELLQAHAVLLVQLGVRAVAARQARRL